MRKIIHIDMDAFYASVEQRDNPSLKGKPVIVGGDPKSRGVVSACSYEARKYGIHSAMASSKAKRLCPHAVFIHGNFDKYITASKQIREIFHEYTDLVEPLSLDEAYLDVTENKFNIAHASKIAQEIRKKIFDKTKLTASAGVSYNKFLAKVASDYNKPDGITIITPERAGEFIESLPIRKFYGIGKVTEKKMLSLGIKTGADLKRMSLHDLEKLFGKAGIYYYYICQGIDDRPVEPERIRKSIGKEITLKEDILDYDMMIDILDNLAGKVSDIMEDYETSGRTITLKVKYHDFEQVTRSVTVDEYISDKKQIMNFIKDLIVKTEATKKKVRLLGISMSGLDIDEDYYIEDIQLTLPFDIIGFPK